MVKRELASGRGVGDVWWKSQGSLDTDKMSPITNRSDLWTGVAPCSQMLHSSLS